MDMRAFLVSLFTEQAIANDEDPEAAVSTLYEASSIDTVPGERPFLLYRLGNLRPQTEGDDGIATWIQPVEIQVHDDPGDFGRVIDSRTEAITNLVFVSSNWPSPCRVAYPYMSSARLDYVSEDLRDPDWGTIFRSCHGWLFSRNPLTS